MALVGTTASGKSALAMELARRGTGMEIVSVDSMQVYRGMDIGTAKPTAVERAAVSHHLLDLAEPGDDFTVAQFQEAFRAALADIEGRGRRALLVGGTGLHFRAVVDDLTFPGRYPQARAVFEADPDTAGLYRRLRQLDPLAAERVEPANRRRIVRALEVTVGSGHPFSSFGPGLAQYPPSRFRLLGVELPAEVVGERIRQRYREQLADGFLAEVEGLLGDGAGLSRTARQALGYRELLSHLEDGVDLDEAVEQAVVRTRRFARRQRAWFRRDPRIHWFRAEAPGSLLATLEAACRSATPPSGGQEL